MAYTKSGKLDKRNYNKIIRFLYNTVHESNITAHKYHDLGWDGVSVVIKVVNDALKLIGQVYDEVFEYSIENVEGYSSDMMSKTYNMQITDMSGNKIIGGNIRGFAAGTVDDPWKSYDLAVMFWNVD